MFFFVGVLDVFCLFVIDRGVDTELQAISERVPSLMAPSKLETRFRS